MKYSNVVQLHAGSLVFCLSILMLSSIYLWYLDLLSLFNACLWLIIPALLIGFIYVCVERPRQLRERSKSDVSLVALYIEYILMFAGLYAISSVISDGGAIANHAFIPNDLMTKEKFIPAKYFGQLILVYIDAIYFSVSTATTVGFGDMHATNPIVKLIVILQVLSCLSVVVFGVGHYFKRDSKDI